MRRCGSSLGALALSLALLQCLALASSQVLLPSSTLGASSSFLIPSAKDTVTSNASPGEVIRFVLYDTASAVRIREISQSDVIDLSQLPSTWNIEAVVEPSSQFFGSVNFRLDDQDYNTDNSLPFTLLGNRCGAPVQDAEFLGADLKQQNNIPSAGECCRLCQNTRGCVKYTYSRASRVCFLKQDVAHVETRALGMVSGSIVARKKTPSSNTFKLVATPYSELNTKGIKGKERTLTVRFVDRLPNSVTSFTLVDANTQKDIRLLVEGDLIDLSEVKDFTVRANLDSASKNFDGSVSFALNDAAAASSSNSAPFILFGTDQRRYNTWKPTAGQYVLTATTFSKKGLQGDAGSPFQVKFSVYASAAAAQDILSPSATGFDFPVVSLSVFDTLNKADVREVYNGDLINLPFLPENWNLRANVKSEGAFTGAVVWDINGQVKKRLSSKAPFLLTDTNWAPSLGTYVMLVYATENADGTGLRSQPLFIRFNVVRSVNWIAPIDRNQVFRFVLVDGDTSKDIRPLLPADVLDLTKLPRNPAVRAEVENTQFGGSVVFVLNTDAAKNLNTRPFTTAVKFKGGDNVLRATATTAKDGQGTKSVTFSIRVTGVEGPTKPSLIRAQCVSFGEPHIYTFDGRGYDFHARGEFELYNTLDGLEQVNLIQWRPDRVGYNVGLAFRSGSTGGWSGRGQVFSVQLKSPRQPDAPTFLFNGNSIKLEKEKNVTAGIFTVHSSGAYGSSQGLTVTVANDKGTVVQIVFVKFNSINHMNVVVSVDGRKLKQTSGLCGVWNFNSEDDLRTRSGTVSPVNVSAPSWNVDSSLSLFTEPPKDVLKEHREVNASSLYNPSYPAALENAREACSDVAGNGEFWTHSCLVDVLELGADAARSTMFALESVKRSLVAPSAKLKSCLLDDSGALLGSWSDYEECSKRCDSGIQYKYAHVYTRDGKESCGFAAEARICNTRNCAGKPKLSAICSVVGAHFIETFDQTRYQFQSEGEFTAFSTLDGSEQLNLLYTRLKSVTLTSGLGFRSGKDSIAFRISQNSNSIVGGLAVTFNGIAREFDVLNTTEKRLQYGGFQVYWSGSLYPSKNEERLSIEIRSQGSGLKSRIWFHDTNERRLFMLVTITAPGSLIGGTKGQCGSYDFNASNDLVFANGTKGKGENTGISYQVPPATSLFAPKPAFAVPASLVPPYTLPPSLTPQQIDNFTKTCQYADIASLDTCLVNLAQGLPVEVDGRAQIQSSANQFTADQKVLDCLKNDVIFGSWQDTETCSKECGRGTIRQSVSVSTAAGVACGFLYRTTTCNEHPCPINCEMTPWVAFTQCPVSCGGGTQIRQRQIKTLPQWDGEPCGAIQETVPCNTQPCPINCVQTSWTNWTSCNAPCGPGKQSRSRNTTTEPRHGGTACGPSTESQDCKLKECPLNCVVSEWGAFGTCSKSCGGGSQTRSRSILVDPKYGGAACPALLDYRNCSTQPCPVDCVVSTFTNWTTCNKPCGGGIESRTRTIVTAHANGGKECPALTETRGCNVKPCPVDCQVSAWSDYGPCSSTCGEGTRSRTRKVIVQDAYGGKLCPTLAESQTCNIKPCPVSCEMTSWSEWTPCSKVCGGGQRTRQRDILVLPANGGSVCGAKNESEVCNATPCPMDCEVSDWTPWTNCSLNCGGGSQTRSRTILQAQLNGGTACPPVFESRKCNDQACPQNCQVSDWSIWGECSASCGPGARARFRAISKNATAGGLGCPELIDLMPCVIRDCAASCKTTDFSAWSECSVPCGGGNRTRTKWVTQQSSASVTNCGPTSETVGCNLQPCPINCQVGNWSAWSSCSATCGTGFQSRTRPVLVAAAHGGAACPVTTETISCNTQPCPLDCRVSDWGAWGTCQGSCGLGYQIRSRNVTRPSGNGGKPCPALQSSAECYNAPCPKTSCTVTQWNDWSSCSAICGGGQKTRTRKLVTTAASCPFHLFESLPCNTQPCPVDCAVGSFGPYTACSVSCGEGIQRRTRNITTVPSGDGKACPALYEVNTCNAGPCPVDCVVGNFSSWSVCSASCGEGLQSRSRQIIVKPIANGKQCPGLTENRKCSVTPCPIDCKLSSWGNWSSCSEKCGGGVRKRQRTVLQSPLNGGSACGELVESEKCNTDPCPVDCVLNNYGPWGNCSQTCGGGTQTRTRTIKQAALYGGKACDALSETTKCNTQPCPINCVVSDWSKWSACSSECGDGIQNSTRTIQTQSAHGGKACPDLIRTQKCNLKPCPVDCLVSAWSAFSECSATCGGGTQSRSRKILRHPQYNGAGCGATDETVKCNEQPCPINCELGPWTNFSKCSVSCGQGVRTRERNITRDAANGGVKCTRLVEVQDCSVSCAQDCQVSSWSAWSKCSESCGPGSQNRTRTILKLSLFGGKACPALVEYQDCSLASCPQDCQLSNWTSWSACTKSCGGGVQYRARKVVKPSAFGGSCGAISDSRPCNQEPCPMDCVVGNFSAWSSCSQSCSGGTRTRIRTIARANEGNGTQCPALEQTQACGTVNCPVDCQVSAYSEWTACKTTAPCGAGLQTRTRTISRQSAFGGRACPALTEQRACEDTPCENVCTFSTWSWSNCSRVCGGGTNTRNRLILTRVDAAKACGDISQNGVCNTQPCPVDCVTSAWSGWSNCSATCGTGFQTRTRTVTTPNANGGLVCGALFESQDCFVACPIDCLLSAWSDWSQCSADCGDGIQLRNRTVLRAPSSNGAECGALVEKKNCFLKNCAINCSVSEFGTWTQCSKTCGNGTRTRSRQVRVAPEYSGALCPPLTESQVCNTEPCPIDCVLGAWKAWTNCSQTCGTGLRTRTRDILTNPRYGGTACQITSQSEECNTNPCPINCTVSAWTPFSACSQTCGPGISSRTRKVVIQSKYGGAACPPLLEEIPCNLKPCPIACEVGAWSSWSKCDVTCGGGLMKRFRNITVDSKHGGASCPSLSEAVSCNTNPCPVDCAVGQWGPWSACSVSCGNGTKLRTRPITITPLNGGKVCPNLTESQSCPGVPCPINCKVSEWTNWTACSATCGSGTQKRSRTVLVASAYNGTSCPALAESQACSIKPCPVDCAMGVWSNWSACTKTCGTGSRSRVRTVLTAPQNNGAACGLTSETQVCGADPCPIFCQVGNWTAWSACSKSCGGGISFRTRVVTVQPKFTNQACPTLREEVACGTEPCPVACQVSEWKPWSNCTAKCGHGIQSRTRVVTVKSANGGKSCPILEETQSCDSGVPCPVDCQVSAWSAWSTCSKPCGGGEQTRTRNITRSPAFGGASCQNLKETIPCNTAGCPQNCEVSAWNEWGTCSVSCGLNLGIQSRNRTVTKPSLNGGASCPVLSERRACGNNCPIDCKWSDWSNYSACSATCGVGAQTRNRSVLVQSAYGGKLCTGDSVERRPCSIRSCPVDCRLSDWTSYSTCTKSCGSGSQTRSRTLLQDSAHGGTACGPLTETRPCNTQNCPIDCVMSAWSDWSICSKKCGNGTQSRNRTIAQPALYLGKECPKNLSESRPCNVLPCPVDCVTSEWGPWEACSAACGEGLQARRMKVITNAAYGGKACPALVETRKCQITPCPVACVLSNWTGWSDCSLSCGGGQKRRTRTVIRDASFGGDACGATTEAAPCNTQPCPVNCVMNDWTSWSACSATCGEGKQTRTRTVKTANSNGGAACPTTTFESRSCTIKPCPVDCVLGNWTEWSSCGSPCGPGTQSRSRTVLRAPSADGKPCDKLGESRGCNVKACPVNCSMSEWSEWSTCDKRCGGGKQTRTRIIKVASQFGGRECGTLTESIVCNTHPCPVDCILSNFTAWSSCSKTCGGGIRERTRKVTQEEHYGGKACPTLKETEACNTNPCPVDCRLSDWSSWSRCSANCGTGRQTRNRTILQVSLNGGKECAALSETQPCSIVPCPIDCELSLWSDWSACSASCGGGLKARRRSVIKPSQYGGSCGILNETLACNTSPCPTDCILSDWGNWSTCSATCGDGLRTQTRKVRIPAANGGKLCDPILSRSEKCGPPCPVDCVVSDWSPWGPCSATCGSGVSRRTRTVKTNALNGGKACPGLAEERPCQDKPCPVNCTLSNWTSWSTCTKTCGSGSQTRTRTVLKAPIHGGTQCGELQEVIPCNTKPCPVDCSLSGWSAWSQCNAPCGGGKQHRNRTVITNAANGGKACDALIVYQDCNIQPCPVDCKLSTWSPWSTCSAACGDGLQVRSATVVTPSANGGKSCGPLQQSQPCNVRPCPVDCKMSDWSNWTLCSITCGGGVKFRNRTVVLSSKNGGVACGPASEQMPCSTEPCPVDCALSDWGAWSNCSVRCGQGFQERRRTISKAPANGGKQCTPLIQTRDCGEPCPVNCSLSSWTAWSDCSALCGVGRQTRTRTVLVASKFGGTACAALTEEQRCEGQKCPVDCVLSNWTNWSVCSKVCGGGSKYRTRTALKAPLNNGLGCGALEDKLTCNTQPCPIDCVVSAWTNWTKCSISCGKGGITTRSRTVVTPDKDGGSKCPILSESKECDYVPCASECKMSDWTPWGPCQRNGTQTRSRTSALSATAFKESICGPLIESRSCKAKVPPELQFLPSILNAEGNTIVQTFLYPPVTEGQPPADPNKPVSVRVELARTKICNGKLVTVSTNHEVHLDKLKAGILPELPNEACDDNNKRQNPQTVANVPDDSTQYLTVTNNASTMPK